MKLNSDKNMLTKVLKTEFNFNGSGYFYCCYLSYDNEMGFLFFIQ